MPSFRGFADMLRHALTACRHFALSFASRLNAGWIMVLLCSNSLTAEGIRLLPEQVTLHGPRDMQRFLVLHQAKGRYIGDATGEAQFTSSQPNVVTVDEAGYLQPVGDGDAVITATVGSRKATAQVTVRNAQAEPRYSFEQQVLPVLTRAGCNSGACHGALAGKGGMKLSLRGYDPDADHFVLTRQAFGRRTDLQVPAQSLMLLKPMGKIKHGGGVKVEADSPEHQILLGWLRAGVPRSLSQEPKLTRLEVFPPHALLKPEAKLPLIVRAVYEDGRAADVTRWAKFNSTEETVAGVDEQGTVTVKGHGEAAITILYASSVATVTITSPYDQPAYVPPTGTVSGVQHNYLDEHINRKLAAIRLPPSQTCTDREFIRRVHLDLLGVLPKAEDVEKFVTDKSPTKRAALIDRLLERPEYVDYWTYKWSDLLLVSSKRMGQPAIWSFHQFIRQSVAQNKPWNRFARDILTAKGSNFTDGAVNYFFLHKDTAQLMETTSVTFMGMSVACARCHNHPLEKWTQDQYWSMANLFSRVGMKNGERGGEVLLQPQPLGEVLHLRRGIPMPPTPLDGKPLALDDPRDRRAYFADWLTAPENPYFARAIINRVWRNFMGRGLVEAEDDLRQTNPPSNVELMTALEKDFIQNGYDVKRLIRLILNSAAYQRSSTPLPGNAADDRFYSRYLLRRLSAEVVLDAYAQITEVATPFNQLESGGRDSTTPIGDYPLGTRAMQLPDTKVVSRFMDAFGRPERDVPCSCERQTEANVAQALHLNNGQTLNDKLRAPTSLLEKWIKEKLPPEEAIRRLYLRALCREPTADEKRQLLAVLPADGTIPPREVLEDLFWAVLTSREFLFNR
jgi:hypothetical protein